MPLILAKSGEQDNNVNNGRGTRILNCRHDYFSSSVVYILCKGFFVHGHDASAETQNTSSFLETKYQKLLLTLTKAIKCTHTNRNR